MRKFTKFKNKLKHWSKRNLTLYGKKVLINSYVISSIGYLSEIYTANIPDIFVAKTTELIRNFLWNGKTWKVAKQTVALSKEHGGLEIPDIEVFLKSCMVKWILKIRFNPKCLWNSIGLQQLQKMDHEYDDPFFLLKCSSHKGLNLNKLPKFYKVCLNAWSEAI